MQEFAKYLEAFTEFSQHAHWVLPALGILFVFLCIVSKGFRNFILGLIILVIIAFEVLWFYSHFYGTEEERAEFKKKVEEVFRKGETAATDKVKPAPTATPTPSPAYPLKERRF